MSITRLNFGPLGSGGDNPTGALVKLDANDADLDTRITAAASATSVAQAAADAAQRVADAAQATAGSAQIAAAAALPKSGGTLTGTITVTVPATSPAALDMRTGAGGIIFRTAAPSGVNQSIIDGVSNDNSAFGELMFRATQFSYLVTAGPRLIVRGTAALSIDSVNQANNAFNTMAFTATGFTFNGGNIQVNGNINATGTITPSDETLKENIKARTVQQGIALSLAKAFSEWDFTSTGEHQYGVIAQTAQVICPQYVYTFDYTPPPVFTDGTTDVQSFPTEKKLAVDKVSMALEASMDLALQLEQVQAQLADALKRIAKLEVSPGTAKGS